MYTCKQASRIASDALDRKLTWYEWLNLKLHLAICAMCRNFEQNIHLLASTVKKPDDTAAVTLSADEREQLRKNIQSIMENK
ncbi:zf-HC2 domain-containing protein [Mariprofundus erugo]|uniref:anti-sigma factor family protein n=1 Tax=Mariprofundus erugo TaxID=2528639 RepID=UPI00159C1908|nr:zf-HC2 domain-containing protein [Mariprofundus erugo]